MAEQNVVVVVPTIRETNIQRFLAAWSFNCPVIVVEDNPEPTFEIDGCTHYSWQDIEKDLGADSWIIPRRTDCIRSYGYLKAWQMGAKTIITLDDDCLPVKKPTEAGYSVSASTFIQSHLDNLEPKAVDRWWNTLDGAHPRGYPYEAQTARTPMAISHGLWRNVADFDSLAQLHYGRAGAPEFIYSKGVIPTGQYYPMCGMNLAWRAEYTPLMYFLLMGQDAKGNAYPYDRFGDIWAGILSKKVLDHLGVGVYSGSPYVNHNRASNVWANFKKEHAGIQENEGFWRTVDAVRLTREKAVGCYRQLADAIGDDPYPYAKQLSLAMLRWSALYE